MIELIGWLSQLIFCFSGFPQAVQCYRTGHGRGLNPGLLWAWFIGEGLAIIYGFLVDLPAPVMVNYIVNFASLLVIMKFKFFPRIKGDVHGDT